MLFTNKPWHSVVSDSSSLKATKCEKIFFSTVAESNNWTELLDKSWRTQIAAVYVPTIAVALLSDTGRRRFRLIPGRPGGCDLCWRRRAPAECRHVRCDAPPRVDNTCRPRRADKALGDRKAPRRRPAGRRTALRSPAARDKRSAVSRAAMSRRYVASCLLFSVSGSIDNDRHQKRVTTPVLIVDVCRVFRRIYEKLENCFCITYAMSIAYR